MMRPLLVDLFCHEGGAAVGYHRAGFEVIGVDIDPEPLKRYPFESICADALTDQRVLNLVACADAVHASPPCQAYSTSTPDQSRHPRLIAPTRALLSTIAAPWVIENVEGARHELVNPVKLCGSAFNLGVRRHRYFESNVRLVGTRCQHRAVGVGRPYGVYGDHPQVEGEYRRPDGTRRGRKATTLDHAQALMGMPWASWKGCCEAIPPAYTEFIGRQLFAASSARSAAGVEDVCAVSPSPVPHGVDGETETRPEVTT